VKAPMTTLYFCPWFTQERERDHFSQFITEGFTSYCKRKRRDKVWILYQSSLFTSSISCKTKSVWHLAYFHIIYHLLNIRICLQIFWHGGFSPVLDWVNMNKYLIQSLLSTPASIVCCHPFVCVNFFGLW
jgi:hypothetical protein